MSEKNFKVKNGDEIVIEVSRAANRNTAAGRFRSVLPQKGLLPLRRSRADAPRRISPEITMNFHDFGQILSSDGAAWTDLDFSVAPPITTDTGIYGEYPYGYYEFGLAEWNLLKDKIFEVDLENFAAKYRKLDYETAELYGLDVYTGAPGEAIDRSKQFPAARNGARFFMWDYERSVAETKWNEDGLKIKKSADLSVIAGAAFVGFGASGYGAQKLAYKTTTTPDFDADAVNFAADADMDVFLVPCPVFEYSFANLPGDASDWMNMLFVLPHRSRFLQNPLIETYLDSAFGKPLNAFQTVRNPSFFSSWTIPAIKNELVTHLKAEADARYFVAEQSGAGWRNPDTFPYLDVSSSPRPFLFTASNFFYQNVAGQVKIYPGALLAVVKKRGEWFYIWANQEFELSKGFQFSC